MARMTITLEIDCDQETALKVKQRVMYAAHKHLISCKATTATVKPRPVKATPPVRQEWIALYREIGGN